VKSYSRESDQHANENLRKSSSKLALDATQQNKQKAGKFKANVKTSSCHFADILSVKFLQHMHKVLWV